MTAFLLALLLAGVPPDESAAIEGFHRREASGFTLLAVSARIDGATALVVDRPATGREANESPLHARWLADHLVLRADGDDPRSLLRLVLDAPAPRANAPTHAIERRHLDALLDPSPADSLSARPILILAANAPPARLMPFLIAAVEGKKVQARPTARSEPLPCSGWWRHLAATDSLAAGAARLVLGIEMRWETRREALAARLLRSLLAETMAAAFPNAEILLTRRAHGARLVLALTTPEDSLEAVVDRARARLRAFRDAPVDDAAFIASRRALQANDQRAAAAPSRWFEDVLLDEIGGEPPLLITDLGSSWEGTTPRFVEETRSRRAPPDWVVVSRSASMPPIGSITEAWPAPGVTTFEALSREDRDALAAGAFARARAALGRRSPSFRVRSSWRLERDDAPITGSVIDSLAFDGAIRRSFSPEGTTLSLDLSPAEGAGAANAFAWNGQGPLDRRRMLDPWVLLEAADAGPVRYGGWIHAGGQGYQLIEKPIEKGVVALYVLPESGLLERAEWREGPGAAVRAHYADYRDVGGAFYPMRLTFEAAGRSLESIDVRSVELLASPGTLE